MNLQQHRFRAKRSTTTAIAIATENIAAAKANKCYVDLVLRDVEKAFDKKWREGLKYKIKNLELNPLLQKTLCRYVSDRYAYCIYIHRRL